MLCLGIRKGLLLIALRLESHAVDFPLLNRVDFILEGIFGGRYFGKHCGEGVDHRKVKKEEAFSKVVVFSPVSDLPFPDPVELVGLTDAKIAEEVGDLDDMVGVFTAGHVFTFEGSRERERREA